MSSPSAATTPRRSSIRTTPRGKKADSKACLAFEDFRDLLKRKDIDAVVIATPDHWHAIPCVLAARAKKDIYCEKPLTNAIAHGRKIVEAVAANKVIFQTGSQQRSEFGGKFRKAVEYVRNGRIGKLKTIRIGVGGPAVACDLQGRAVPRGDQLRPLARAGPEARLQLRPLPQGHPRPLPGLAQLPRVRRRRPRRHGRAPLRHRPVGARHGRLRPRPRRAAREGRLGAEVHLRLAAW